MTREDRGHYAKKHPADHKANTKIAEAVRRLASNGEIPCAVAFKISHDLKTSPAKIGITADLLEIPVVKCQLGLFGYSPKKTIIKPAKVVSQALEDSIRDSMVGGRISCKATWDIAKRLDIGKMDVSSACEALKIKIVSCQLGAF